MNATVYRRVPGAITIAEESTAWPGVTRPTHLGGLGFGFKWNMGWMHDTLDYVSKEPIYRQYHHHQMTFSLMYAFTENFILPFSHDEVVYGKKSLLSKMPGDHWQQAAGLRTLLAFMWAHPGKQLLFMGSEFGQGAEWADSRSLDWWLLDDPLHSGLQRLTGDLNRVYRASPALYTQDTSPAGFSWIDANDASSNTFSFLRWGDDGSVLACVVNFSGGPHEGYPAGAAAHRPLAGGPQHRLRVLRRVRGGQPRVGLGRAGAVARPARVGDAAGAADRRAVAALHRRAVLRSLTPVTPAGWHGVGRRRPRAAGQDVARGGAATRGGVHVQVEAAGSGDRGGRRAGDRVRAGDPGPGDVLVRSDGGERRQGPDPQHRQR